MRYFELMGIGFENGDIIKCPDKLQADEWEDAYLRFYDPSKKKSGRITKKNHKSYHHKISAPKPANVIFKTFNLRDVKQAAKACDATITEYLTAQIFFAIANERNARGSRKPITIMIPIDCRTFFPTKTLRSFVDSITIVMHETDNFSEMVVGIRQQFAKITPEFIQKIQTSFKVLKQKRDSSPVL